MYAFVREAVDTSVNWLIVQNPENFDDSRAYYPPKLLFWRQPTMNSK